MRRPFPESSTAPQGRSCPGVDELTFRKVLGRFATGVTLVTTRDGERIHGMTANAFTSVSLRPPLVLVAVNGLNRTAAMIKASRCFAVNILPEQGRWIAERFAARDKGADPFAQLTLTRQVTGAPILADCLAWVDCALYQEVEAGDHTVFFGEVQAAGEGALPCASPLIFYRGQYCSLEL